MSRDAPVGSGPATARAAALLITGAMVVWMAGNWLGGRLGLPLAFAFLLDFACLAALGGALTMIYRVWRAGPEDASPTRRDKEN